MGGSPPEAPGDNQAILPDGQAARKKEAPRRWSFPSCGAFWLIELIGCFLPDVRRDRKCRDFCVWPLKVRPGCEADLTCDDGDGRVIVRLHLSFTDFPLPETTLYLEYGTLMLPSER
jgi:hypothetical protein